MRFISQEFGRRSGNSVLAVFGFALMAVLFTAHPAFALKYATVTGTVTGTAAGSAQIDVVATYSTDTGTSCGNGGDNAPTFEVQWDAAPADWVGYGTSGALSDGDGNSPYNYSITTGLTPGLTYSIRVIYNDTNGVNSCSGPSQTVNGNNVSLPNNPLTVGTNSAVVNSMTQITVTATFTGDQNTNSSTQVEYNTSDSWPGTTKCASITTGSPRTCIVDGLQAGTQYWFRVTHTDSDGVTGTNPQVIGPYTTLADNGLTVGTNSAVVNSSTQITVTATFTGDANADSTTQVEYNTSDSWPGTTKCASITTGSPRTCVVDGLQAGTQYWFRVTHTDSDGVTGTNPQVIGPYATLANNPLTVGINSAVADSPTQITVTATFTGDDNANSTTQVEYNTSDSWPGTVKCASITGASPRSCVVDGLQANTQYWFRITHTDGDGVVGTNPEVIGPYATPAVAGFGCGSCHGSQYKTPSYEAAALPLDPDACNDTGRGLHGTHNNYSSSTFKTAAGGKRGNCDYCHTATAVTGPTATHNNGYVNITGNIVTGGQSMDTTGLDYNSGSQTCTNACHKNRGTTAPWGNYTSTLPVSIELSCRSCHDDVTDKAATLLSGAHGTHLNTAISTGGTAMGAANNAGCTNCHPDNSNDLWSAGRADDGSKKAYPHASDGTNVVFDNASLVSGISAARAAGSGDTCANACHKNTSDATWGTTELGCDACHYYGGPDRIDPPTFSGNSSAVVKLLGKHGAHFAIGKTCSDCHSVPLSNGDTAHVTGLPVAHSNAAVTRTGMTFDRVTDPNNPTCTFGGSGSGTGCHGDNNTTPSWYMSGSFDCGSCHAYPASGNEWTSGNGHLARYDPPVVYRHMLATGYTATTDTYASITADSSRCGFCHEGGTHWNGTVEVTSSGRGFNNCTTTDYTINVNATGSNVTCGNVYCHSGVTTPNWY